MDLFLIRHADALPLGENGVTEDEQRPLSDKGEKQSHALGKFLKAQGLVFDRIVSSPIVRARQTAEILLKSSAMGLELEFSDSLTPNARPKKLSRYLLKTGGDKVAVVGHMPNVGDFTAWLIGGKKAQIDFPKAGIALVSIGESPIKGSGSLQWLLAPELY